MTSAIDRLVTDSARLSADRRGTPAATYRIQMHRGFPFQKVAEITDYLHALGISHVYTSSLLTAKSCSNHGYDVTDHSRINPEIGTEQEFSAWVAGLRERKMGVILDVVPNHMSVSGENAWWADVLEHGPSSPYARYFDIAWANHFRQQLHGKVLLPILGESYGKAVDGGQFRPVYAGGAVWIELNGRRLPTDPRTWDAVLAPAVDGARAVTGQDTEGVLELQSILTAVRNLPSRNETDPEKVVIRRAEVAVIKRRLAELDRRYPTAAEEIRKAVAVLAGVPGDPAGMTGLDQFLDAQAYRACDWRVASDEINYRRFFDVNDLAALNTERPEVFEDVHRLIFEWLGRGLIDGLRIDHIDGLYDPRQYLDRLQTKYLTSTAKRLLAERPDDYPGLTWAEAEPVVASQTVSGRPLFVVVEKILTGDETAPEDWATEGTSGYEFLNAVNGLFVDPAGETEITRIYEAFTGIDDSVDEIVYRKKFLVLQSSLTGELHTLSHQLDSLA
ncbi:MAG TPA: alpha-amylase family glycosyl hydrolase, partial [Fimbriiglobus sp.]